MPEHKAPLLPKDKKIVLAPMNFANMPIEVVKRLRKMGYTAEHVQYTRGGKHKFYELDKVVDYNDFRDITSAQFATLKEYLERDFDIFHFWNKSFCFDAQYSHYTGVDIPLIKARGKKVIHRSTGFDVRTPKLDLESNKYSPFRNGYEHLFDQDVQQQYMDFLREYVDQFVVQDPELQQFVPEAILIPRALDLTELKYVGIKKNECPVVVHAPSSPLCKGTKFVLKAVERLKEEGVKFEFKLIEGVKHEKAMEIYQNSDVIIDQLLIGATGVLTLEGMALGKPVICFLREDLFKSMYGNEMPVINANPDTIYDKLKMVISDYEMRQHYSKFGREMVEKVHSMDDVIDQYLAMYANVLDKPATVPTGYRDLEYVAHHVQTSRSYARKITAPKTPNMPYLGFWARARQHVKPHVSDSTILFYRRIRSRFPD